MNLLLRILHLKRKPPHHTRNSTPQLGLRKILPNTTPRPMQKGNLREIRGRTPIIIRDLIARFIRVNPSLRLKLISIFAPEDRGAVDGVGAEDDACALGNVLASHRGVADGFADCGWDCWVEAEDFLADAV